MRILLVADVVGGVRTFVRELASELAAREVELHLALIGPEPGPLPARSCQVRDLRLEWMPEPWTDVAATAAWVDELRDEWRPDVVHMNTFAPVLREGPGVGGGPPVLLTVHSCVLTWWRAVHGVDAPAEWDRYRGLVNGALQRAELVVAPTLAFLDALRSVHGPLPHARVIRNGRSTGAPPRFEARERLVVSVGRLWDQAKNARAVVAAAPSIDGRVVLIGPGEVAGVEALGPVDAREVIPWLYRAAVFAEPARYEPFGLAALEAALCGCALVLGDIASLRELWDGAASFVPPDDPDALAFEVNRLLSSPDRLRAAAIAAYGAARRYRPAAMADAYLDAYRSLQRDRSLATMTKLSSPSRSGVAA